MTRMARYNGRDWLDAKAAADRLGVSRDTIYRLLQDEKLPGVRIGWKWRVSVTELDRIMGEHGGEVAEPAAAARFAVGDRVEKYTGDYTTVGEVRMVGTTKAGKLRYVVELEPGGLLMIYNESQLRPGE